MTDQSTPKVRLVRCPRCRLVLPELANVPVYQCGGCNAILQAKKRKNDTKDTGVGIHETYTAQKNELEQLPNDKKDPMSSQGEKFHSTGELLLDKNCRNDEDGIEDSNTKQPGVIKFSIELSSLPTRHGNEESLQALGEEVKVDQDEGSLEHNYGGDQNERYCNGSVFSTQLTHHGNEESSAAVTEEVKTDPKECSLDYNDGEDQNEHGYCDRKQPGCVSFLEEVASPTRLNHHYSGSSSDSSPVAGAHSEVDLEQNEGGNHNEEEFCSGRKPASVDFFRESEDSSALAGVQCELVRDSNDQEQTNGGNRGEFGNCEGEWPGNSKFSSEASTTPEFNCQEMEESSHVGGTNAELVENLKGHFIVGCVRGDDLLAASSKDSTITSQRPLAESCSIDNQVFPCGEHLEESEKIALRGLDHVSSVDALENSAVINPHAEFGVAIRDMARSPTTRSYAYDGSVSSYDGTDDQAESATTKAFPRSNDNLNTIPHSYPEMQHQAWNDSSISTEKKHHAMKSSKQCPNELLDSPRHGHPVRSRIKVDADERLPIYSRGCQVGYATGDPSNYVRNEFHCSTSFLSSNKPEYHEEEKMELLKMVYELQEQLNRINISKGKANVTFPGMAGREKSIPSFNDMETCHDLSNARYSGRCSQGTKWSHRDRVPQIPFSAGAAINRHQVSCSCLHCCPQDWQRSEPLPPHNWCNRNQYSALPSRGCYNFYLSSPSTQHYASSEFPLRNCDTQSDGRCHRNHNDAMKYSRERLHMMKRYVRPVAGGAPFLVCYRCSELLQMPADFLLFRRRCHQLTCSACSAILKLSLQNGTHLVQYADFNSDAIAPPPSEVDDCSDAKNGRKLAAVSCANNCGLADPVSSDDYGPSLCKSCSTEGESSSILLPLHALKTDSNYRKISSGSSSEPVEETKQQPTFPKSQRTYKNARKTTVSRSSEMSKTDKFLSEIEELSPSGNSALHRLMGYTSPSEVMDY